MEYAVFKEEVKKRIKKHLPERYQSWKLEERQIYKINEILEAFHMMPNDSTQRTGMFPTFYYRDYFSLLEKKWSMEEILELIADSIKVYSGVAPAEGVEANLERFRDDMICAVINQKGNEAFLETIPHRKFLNLAVIYRVHIYEPDGGWSGMTVTNEYLKTLGIDLEELHEKAMEHTLELLPPKLTDLDREYGSAGILPRHSPSMFMLSNEPCDFGAAMLLYTDVLDMAAEAVGGSFYILPGSIHELYLVPECPEYISFYRRLIRNANREVSCAKDWLSDDLYLYNFETHRLTLVSDIAGA